MEDRPAFVTRYFRCADQIGLLSRGLAELQMVIGSHMFGSRDTRMLQRLTALHIPVASQT